jgi:hypothetical protein
VAEKWPDTIYLSEPPRPHDSASAHLHTQDVGFGEFAEYKLSRTGVIRSESRVVVQFDGEEPQQRG